MTVPTRKALGHRIRTLRKANRLTQQKLALMVDVERSNLAKIEAGSRNVSFDSLEKIAGGLGVTLSELVFDVEREGRENPSFQNADDKKRAAKSIKYGYTKL